MLASISLTVVLPLLPVTPATVARLSARARQASSTSDRRGSVTRHCGSDESTKWLTMAAEAPARAAASMY